jgi:hypothetical protein
MDSTAQHHAKHMPQPAHRTETNQMLNFTWAWRFRKGMYMKVGFAWLGKGLKS